MTDRELLELAAKAAGIKKDASPYNGGGLNNTGFDCMGNLVTDWHNGKYWSPLTDDGDALRLAVKLGIEYRRITLPHNVGIQAYDGTIQAVFESCGNDLYAATRRAIVRAAAEIGKGMK